MQKLQLQQQVGFHQRANITNLLRVRSDVDCAASVAVDCAHFWIEARAIFVRFSQRFSISHLIFTSSAPLSLSAPTSLYILQLYRYLRLYLWLYLWLWLYLCLSNSCSCIYSPSSPPTGGTSLSGLPAWVHFNCQRIPLLELTRASTQARARPKRHSSFFALFATIGWTVEGLLWSILTIDMWSDCKLYTDNADLNYFVNVRNGFFLSITFL